MTARVLSQRREQCALSKGGSAVRSPRQMVHSPSSTRSSRAGSGRSPAWAGRWTMTRCSSAMSPTRTRTTPRGRWRWAEISAMDRMSRQRAPMARCSTVSFGVCSPVDGGDQRLDLQSVVGGPGAPAGHGIGPDALRFWCRPSVGSRHGGVSPGGPSRPPGPAGCRPPARDARRPAITYRPPRGLGAQGGRAAWSSARRPGVRTSPVRLTNRVIS